MQSLRSRYDDFAGVLVSLTSSLAGQSQGQFHNFQYSNAGGGHGNSSPFLTYHHPVGENNLELSQPGNIMPTAPLFRKIIIILLVAAITSLHYTIPDAIFFHVIYRELYFLPILLAALWFGLAGGLAASLTIAVLYGPVALLDEAGFTVRVFANLLEIFLFISVGALLGYLRDREKANQEKLREAESLAAMGRSVSAVAHEMKAPLTAIGGFARQVRRTLAADSSEANKLDIVADQTSRLETMIRDMLAFARPLELQPMQADLNDLAAEGVEVAQETAAQHGVSLQLRKEENELPCSVDKNRFHHVFLNLLINGIEASPEGERVIIRTFRQNEFAWLEVADRGPGIPPAQRESIFEPFFTTKENGTGLGLPIAKKIIEAHNGRLEIADRQGGGTVFRMKLPLVGRR
jgi:two-component system, NtrC family, sensor histidine kinase HydH